MTPVHRATLIVQRLAILPSDQKRTVEMIAAAIAAAVLAENKRVIQLAKMFIMSDKDRAHLINTAIRAEKEAWLAACREVAGWYPEGVFDPDGQTLDAKSAAMARLTVKNVQETRARRAQDEGE